MEIPECISMIVVKALFRGTCKAVTWPIDLLSSVHITRIAFLSTLFLNFDTWSNIFRNLDKLNSLKSTFLTMAGVAIKHLEASNEPDITTNYLTNKIKLWRTHLRKYEYLLSPKMHGKLTTVTGDILDQGLLNFTDTAIENRKMFYDSIIGCENLSNPSKVQRVCVTISEKQNDKSIQNQTKDSIRSYILVGQHKTLVVSLFEITLKISWNQSLIESKT